MSSPLRFIYEFYRSIYYLLPGHRWPSGLLQRGEFYFAFQYCHHQVEKGGVCHVAFFGLGQFQHCLLLSAVCMISVSSCMAHSLVNRASKDSNVGVIASLKRALPPLTISTADGALVPFPATFTSSIS
jgi:hypothetical protein